MTIEELAAIRARVEKGGPSDHGIECSEFEDAITADVRALLAEVERLRAEAAAMWSVGHKRTSGEPLVTCSECGERNPYVGPVR